MSKKYNNKNGFIVVLLVLALGTTTYLIINKNKKSGPKTTADYVNGIIGNPASGLTSGDYNTMLGYGIDYLTAWYNALQNKLKTFVLNGKTYHTAGGTAV